MAINRYYNRSPYDLGLYTPPVDTMYKSLEALQKRYEQNSAMIDNLRTVYINALPQDRARATEIQNGWFKSIDEMVAKSGGDLASVTKDLNRLVSTIRKDLSPTGEAGTIAGNYAKYQDWRVRHQERIKSKDIIGSDFSQAQNYVLNKYKGVQFDNESQMWSGNLELPELASYVPIDEMAIKQINALNNAPQSWKKSRFSRSNGLLITNTDEYKGVTAERIENTLSSVLGADPRVQSYLQDRLKFAGQDPALAGTFLSNYAKILGGSFAWEHTGNDINVKNDNMAIMREKHRLDNMLMQQYMPLTETTLTSSLNGDFKPLTSVADAIMGSSKEEEALKALKGATSLAFGVVGALGGAGPVGLAAALPELVQRPGLTWAFRGDLNNIPLAQVLKDATLRDRMKVNNVDVSALEAALEVAFKEPNARQMYDANPKVRQRIDKEVLDVYNRSMVNMSARKGMALSLDPKVQDKVLDQEVRRLTSLGGQYYDPETKATYGTDNLNSEVLKVLQDPEKRNQVQVSLVAPQPGIPVGGYKVDVPYETRFGGRQSKTIIIPTGDPRIKDVFTDVYQMFRPIWENGERRGNPKTGYGTPVREFMYDPHSGTLVDQLYLEAVVNGKTQRRPTSTADIQLELANQLQLFMPRGQTRSDATQYSIGVGSPQVSPEASSAFQILGLGSANYYDE